MWPQARCLHMHIYASYPSTGHWSHTDDGTNLTKRFKLTIHYGNESCWWSTNWQTTAIFLLQSYHFR